MGDVHETGRLLDVEGNPFVHESFETTRHLDGFDEATRGPREILDESERTRLREEGDVQSECGITRSLARHLPEPLIRGSRDASVRAEVAGAKARLGQELFSVPALSYEIA